MQIRLGYLYPQLMNLYGDRGNIIALQRRSYWHGIDLRVDVLEIGAELRPYDYDFLFIGGGQDREQKLIAEDMVSIKGDDLIRAIQNDCVVLAICGGYQLLGRYYQVDEQTRLPGLGIMPIHTVGGVSRMICNTAIQTTFSGSERTLVGFVNHGGQTHLDANAVPLGTILAGEGNHLGSLHEGCIVNQAYGTYLHGALLPKNPWFCDYLLGQALAHRGISWRPSKLDDSVEERAHREAVALARAGTQGK